MSLTTADKSSSAAQRIEELGRIIMAYSEVTEKLQVSHEQLQRTVAALQHELSEKNSLLERRNRLAALGEMAAGMAHEIRNPLGGIQLYASMLADDVANMPNSLELVGKISGGVKRLESLVSQVLQFTREMRLTIRDADVAAVITEAVELARGRSEKAGISVVLDGPTSLAARVDPLLLGQAVLNLVLNAIEACEMATNGANAAVFVHYAVSDERQCSIVIEDSAAGIPADVMDKLFNPFFTTKDYGTGLGLAIVHRIVEAHDGTIVVTNRAAGGARFEMRL